MKQAYTPVLRASASRDLRDLDTQEQLRTSDQIGALAADPVPQEAEALAGVLKGYYRIRIGKYRVVYRVHHEGNLVRVLAIGTRDSI
jgi:mRNA interferase RelE/StbE